MNDRPPVRIEDDPPISARDALAIIEQERRRSEPDISVFFLIWGAVWLVIGVGFFAAGQGMLDYAVAGASTGVAILAGSVASAVLGARMGRGVDGPSTRDGMRYGLSWTVAMIGTGVLVGGLSRFGGPGVSVLAPALFVFVVGVLFTAGSMYWHSTPDYILGVVVQVVAMISVLTPVPWNSLVMGVGGGGTLIAVGVWRHRAWWRDRRS